jgi:DsbC/DsbD-like thiol-disulfide interchange protein
MNKKIILLMAVLCFTGLTSRAQIQSPVKWAYAKKKVSVDTYEIILRATIQDGWHIYAQIQPGNSISKPTGIKFNAGDDFTLIGKAKEVGKLVRFEDPSSGLGANEYANTVDFVQMIKLNKTSVSNISGSIIFQSCTDKMCLPPDNVQFSVPLK